MPTLEEYDRAMKELKDSNDRTTAIVAATLLEAQLEAALMRRLLPMSNAHRDALFRDEYAYTFASKIDLGLSLGLYEQKTKTDCHRIKQIRNQFAHNLDRDFGHPKVSKACQDLTNYDTTTPLSPEAMERLEDAARAIVQAREWRWRYVFAVIHIYTGLFKETETIYLPPRPTVLKD